MSKIRIRPITLLVAFIMVFSLLLAACQPAATEEPAAAEEPAEVMAGSVGVVLPNKNEPRWIQDETRFQVAFDAAGYDVEIL